MPSLDQLAQLAFHVAREDYQLDVQNIELVSAHSFNTIFRVDSTSGPTALRIGDSIRIHPTGVEDTEAAWLDALAEANVSAPQNIRTSDGRAWVLREHPGVRSSRVCTLFTWLQGRELRGQTSTELMRRAGRMLARLHEIASTDTTLANPPVELSSQNVIYLGQENMLAQSTGTDSNMIQDAIGRVQLVLDELWRGRPHHVLHGDFGAHNLMVWRDRLQPIDFQDLRIGPAALDLGITMADLGRSEPGHIDPFKQGYAEIRELPELSSNELTALAIGRSLNIMNLALIAPDSGIARSFETHCQQVAHGLEQLAD